MNLPNIFTFLRIILAFICIGLVVKNTLFSLVLSLVLFIIASITDFFDGVIARKKGKVTDLGKLLDPIADKILIIGLFLAFIVIKEVNLWVVIVIMLREFIITGVRLFALNRGYVLEAKYLGKHKTFSQMVGIIAIFIVLILKYMYPQNKIVIIIYEKFIPLLLMYIVIITLFSGIYYLWTNRRLIKTY